MKDFNAKQAKQIADSYSDELHNILVDIRAEAELGETSLRTYKPIGDKTIHALRDRGFKVLTTTPHPSGDLLHFIYWD